MDLSPNVKNSNNTLTVLGSLVILTFVIAALPLNYPAQAETGKGTDVFKVIMTIFGVDESIGDVVAIVTAKNEAAKVKLFDASGPLVTSLNTGEGGGHLIEYVATFPNVTINAGDVYKACVLTTMDLNMVCNTGQNSPASRPEFVDISLNATSTTLSDETISEESDEGDEGNED